MYTLTHGEDLVRPPRTWTRSPPAPTPPTWTGRPGRCRILTSTGLAAKAPDLTGLLNDRFAKAAKP
jgi:hypothetical protein